MMTSIPSASLRAQSHATLYFGGATRFRALPLARPIRPPFCISTAKDILPPPMRVSASFSTTSVRSHAPTAPISSVSSDQAAEASRSGLQWLLGSAYDGTFGHLGSLIDKLILPLTDVFLSLPPSLGLSYASFVILATISLRGLTFPISLWSRNRLRRYNEGLAREVTALNTRIRSLGKPKAELSRMSDRQIGAHAYQLDQLRRREMQRVLRDNKLNPWKPIIVTVLVQGSLFLTLTTVIRRAVAAVQPSSNPYLSGIPMLEQPSSASLPPDVDLGTLFDSSKSALQALHPLALEPGPLLADTLLTEDLALALLCGGLFYTSMTISAAARGLKSADRDQPAQSSEQPKAGPRAQAPMTREKTIAAERTGLGLRQIVALLSREWLPWLTLGGSIFYTAFSACHASALALYWTTTFAFSTAQNWGFLLQDRKTEANVALREAALRLTISREREEADRRQAAVQSKPGHANFARENAGRNEVRRIPRPKYSSMETRVKKDGAGHVLPR